MLNLLLYMSDIVRYPGASGLMVDLFVTCFLFFLNLAASTLRSIDGCGGWTTV